MQNKLDVKRIRGKERTRSISFLYSKKFELTLVSLIVTLILLLFLVGEYLLRIKLSLPVDVSIGLSCSIFVAVLVTVKVNPLQKILTLLITHSVLFILFGYGSLLVYYSSPLAFISIFADLLIFIFVSVCVSLVVFIEMYRCSRKDEVKAGESIYFGDIIRNSFTSQGFVLIFTLSLWLLFVGVLASKIFEGYSNDEMVGVWMFFSWLISSIIAALLLVVGMLLATKGAEKSFKSVALFIAVVLILMPICITLLSTLFSAMEKTIA